MGQIKMSSMCDKILCLGKKQELEDKKMDLFTALADITSINFDNINLSNDSNLHDAVENFINWVRKNKVSSNSDEVLDNIDSGMGLVDLKHSALNQMADILLKTRELAVLGSSGTATAEDITNISSQIEGKFAEMDRVARTTIYNGTSVDDSEHKPFYSDDGVTSTSNTTFVTFFDITNINEEPAGLVERIQTSDYTGISDQAGFQTLMDEIDNDLSKVRSLISDSDSEYKSLS